MGLSTSMFVGLSGLNANARQIEVTGNNIANANTVGFKASRVAFETQLLQNLSQGKAPSAELGGSNPSQVGLGVRTGTITRDFSTGSIQPTGFNTDIALEGAGFFILDAAGQRYYSRAGNFSLDSDFNLVNSDGAYVQGYGVDNRYNVVEGTLRKVNIPIGQLKLVEATSNIRFGGNLDSSGDVATQGSLIVSNVLYADNAAGALADANTSLSSLFDAQGNALLADGDVLTLNGATRGDVIIPAKKFQVGVLNTAGADAFGTTVQSLLDFLRTAMGIDPASGGGVTMSSGQIRVEGNTGEDNDLSLESPDLIRNAASDAKQVFQFNKEQAANGESVRTTFVAYDSLGNPATVDLTMVLESRNDDGTTWRFDVQSEDDTDFDRVLGSGALRFDTRGQLLSSTGNDIRLDRAATGATTPQTITLAFEDEFSSITSLADVRSQIAAIRQDGAPLGVLQDFNISEDGTIVGAFSNSLLRDLGRIPLAVFTNPLGLVEQGGNLFVETRNSGSGAVVAAGTGGSGRMIGGALELSNVDLSKEFIGLIAASTGFNASSRVLSTSDRLFQELLSTLR